MTLTITVWSLLSPPNKLDGNCYNVYYFDNQ